MDQYVYYRCKRDKGTPKKFSSENFMIPSPVPLQLQDLTQFEEMLIARAFPVIHVYTKPKGGQRAYKGHVITLPLNVQQLADILPRCPEDLPVIVFTVNRKDNSSKDFTVRGEKVSDALHWLVLNNPLYSHIKIDSSRIQALPENGKLTHIRKVNFTSEDVESHNETDKEPDIDRGPVDKE